MFEDNDFTIVGIDESATESFARKPVTYWGDAMRRFRQNKVAVFAFFLLCAMILMIIPNRTCPPASSGRRPPTGSEPTTWAATSLPAYGREAGSRSPSASSAPLSSPSSAVSMAASPPTSADGSIC